MRRDHAGDVVGGVGTKIEAGAVKRIDESGGIAHHGPAVAADLRVGIRQRGKCVHVAFHDLRVRKNFAADGMREQVIAQSLTEIHACRQFENARIVNQPRAHIAAL